MKGSSSKKFLIFAATLKDFLLDQGNEPPESEIYEHQVDATSEGENNFWN